ncbi:hypothetical protein TIFTF001_025289 [Ficus carica]|uniref:Uncharacterized protein n=1 Tax=Ficus carica TaxID=3494 RepID=A0AA88APP8_FICCA|nr:hypothetical protein TIFTF001_025289 [Ficus carica]
MADQRKWLSIKSSELNKAIKLYLLNWPQFQSAVDVVRERGKAEFSSRVFDFFATSTSVPTVDGLAENLFRAMSSLQASIALNFCKEVISSSSPLGAEHLLHAYNAYLAAGGLYNPAEISRESVLGFKQSMDSALAEWPEFETVSHMLGVQRGDTVATAMFFFFAKPDPTMDGLAEEMHRAISTDLDGLIDFSDVKKAAQEFLDALLSCCKFKVLNKPINLKRQQSVTSCDTAEVKKAKY